MASGVNLEVPLRELLCHPCQVKLQPIQAATDTELFEMSLPARPGQQPIMVEIQPREFKFEEDGDCMRIRAVIDLPCTNCGEPHVVERQLQAAQLYVRGLRKCQEGHTQTLKHVKAHWCNDPSTGPYIEVEAALVCPWCNSLVPEHDRLMLQSPSALPVARTLELDLNAHKATPRPEARDAVPLPKKLEQEPFERFPMLRWARSRLERELGGKPFAGLRTAMVLHFLTDLLPFAQACLDLGLSPAGSVFFYKSEYQYPHKEAIGQWLGDRGFTVRPVEQVPEWIGEQGAATDAAPLLIVEDGGYLVPRLHRDGSPLLARVIGAVEQTTKGLRATEKWGAEVGAARDLTGHLRFPLLSIPDSQIKLEVEPPLIGLNVINCIQALEPALSLPGLRVALFGLGTIGMEVFSRLHSMGALVTGFDLEDKRRTKFRMKGGELASSAAEAARGKKLLIGCSGTQSITADVIANLQHGAYIASASSDRVEIDHAYLEDAQGGQYRLGRGERDWEPGTLWAGTRYVLAGMPPREIILLADGYPVTFWGFTGMPHQGGDLIMTVILITAAELAARNGPNATGKEPRFAMQIERQAVDLLGKKYTIETEYLRQYFPDARP
jgi:adenosylhomocysteinase